jgi:Tfp pilus assembly protein PilV
MKGQTLIESVLAFGVISIVLSSIAIILVSSLNNAGQGKDQVLATQYAQEGIEILRKIRNSDYQAFGTYSGSYCLAKDSSVLGSPSSCSVPNVDSYIRSVTIEQSPGCGVSVAKIIVKVAWTDGKCISGTYCHSAELISCLSTVNPIQAP